MVFLVKQLPCVKYHYNEDLNLIYLSANKKQPSKYKQSKCGSSESNASAASSVEANDKEIYLPFLSFDDINLCSMEKIQMILCKNESLKPNSLILAIVDPNSSILYYKLTNGFLDLDAIQ